MAKAESSKIEISRNQTKANRKLRITWPPPSSWIVFLTFGTIYAASGCYRWCPFNAHVYIADAMLHGRFDLLNPPGYFELIHFAGHNSVAYGVGPSLLMLPFVAIWGLGFHQALFNAAVGALTVTLWWSTLGRLGSKGTDRIWLTLLFGLGSLFWFYAGKNGSTWNLTHVTAIFGLMLAIREVAGEQRAWAIGLGFGLAVLSRQPVLLALPFFAVMLAGNEPWQRLLRTRYLSFALVFGMLGLFGCYYNYARFGNPFENGYARLILNSQDVGPREWGLFNIVYVPNNIRVYLLGLPARIPKFPWFDPGLGGFSILISTPALYLAAAADYRKRLNIWALITSIVIQLEYLAYYGIGYTTFGCRYSLDYLPFVMLLAASGTKHLPRWALIAATVFGASVEIWGLVWEA